MFLLCSRDGLKYESEIQYYAVITTNNGTFLKTVFLSHLNALVNNFCPNSIESTCS